MHDKSKQLEFIKDKINLYAYTFARLSFMLNSNQSLTLPKIVARISTQIEKSYSQ